MMQIPAKSFWNLSSCNNCCCFFHHSTPSFFPLCEKEKTLGESGRRSINNCWVTDQRVACSLAKQKGSKETHLAWKRDVSKSQWSKEERTHHGTVAFPSKNTDVSLSLEKKKRVTIWRIEVPSFLSRVTTNSKKKKIQKSPFGSSSLSFLKTSLSQA